jgi:hypothetical protein
MVVTAMTFTAQWYIKVAWDAVFTQRREASTSRQTPCWFIFVWIAASLMSDKVFSVFLLAWCVVNNNRQYTWGLRNRSTYFILGSFIHSWILVRSYVQNMRCRRFGVILSFWQIKRTKMLIRLLGTNLQVRSLHLESKPYDSCSIIQNIRQYLTLILSFERFSQQNLTHISPLSSYEATAHAVSKVSYDSFIYCAKYGLNKWKAYTGWF